MKFFLLVLLLVCCTDATALNRQLRDQAWVYPGSHTDCHSPGGPQQAGQRMVLAQLQQFQHYCVRIPVQLDADVRAPTVLSAAFLASARLYWDGEHIADKGTPGSSRVDEVSGPLATYVTLTPQQLRAGEHWLSMDWSAYHHGEKLHQIFYLLALLDEDEIHNAYQALILPWLLCGAMFILALIFALVYWRYQKNPAYLMFSLLCLCAGILLVLELIKFYWNYPWTWHVIRLRTVIPVVALTGLFLVAYYLHYYQVRSLRRWILGSLACFILLALFTPSYDGKSLAIFLAALLISLCLSLSAWRQSQAGARQHSVLLCLGLTLLVLLPFSFIDQWFAALFAVLAIANVYNLTGLFASDRERALQALRLEGELLRRQLQPHFLFNSLTLITEWVETQPQQAVQFIEQLAGEFRLLNRMSQQRLVPWHDERALCEQHFAIMQQRIQKDIRLQITADGENFMLPPAIVHTLVENAFAHNRWLSGDRLLIHLQCVQHQVRIRLETPYRTQQHQGCGTGERYIRARLSQCFGSDWQFQQRSEGECWYSDLRFPQQEMRP